MKLGYSNLLQEFVPADLVNYGDCKDFQIVCPNCREAVFKVARSATGVEYLAHYRASKAHVAECELRVAQISKREIEARSIISQGQHLKLFQSVLRQALLDKADTANWSAAMLDDTIQSMVKRPTYRELVRFARDCASSGRLNDIWDAHLVEWSTKSPYYKDTQIQFAKDMYAHMLAPNSFMLFAFGISLATIVSMGLLTGTDRKDDTIFHNVIGALIGGSDRDVRKVYQSDKHREMTLATIVSASLALRSWLVTLPYMDILRQHTKLTG